MRYIAVTVALVAVSACSNVSSTLTPSAKGAAAPASSSSQYTYYKIDVSSCGPAGTTSSVCDTEVTGINDARDIVGNDIRNDDLHNDTCNATTSGIRRDTTSAAASCDCPIPSGVGMPPGYYWSSYTSKYTGSGYAPLNPAVYPYHGASQYLYAIGNRRTNSDPNSTVEVGCAVSHINGPKLRATYAAVDNGGVGANPGVWSTLVKASGNGNNNCIGGAVGELLSIDDNDDAIGYYNEYPNVSGSSLEPCVLDPYVDLPGDNHSPITVTFSGPCDPGGSNPFVSVGASGISSDGTLIVGFATTKNSTYGWYASYSKNIKNATVLCYNGDKNEPTAFTGVRNDGGQPEIVGWYAENTTSSAKTHGFVLDVTTGTNPYHWRNVNAKGALGYTVISGTNNKGDICGWDKGADGRYHGFVGIDNAAPRGKVRRSLINPRA